MYEKTKNTHTRYIFAQASAYMTSGIFLSLSSFFENSLEFRYLGYIFISTSFILLIGSLRFQIARRLTLINIIFSGALSMITVAILILSLLSYIIENPKPENIAMGESSVYGMAGIIVVWILLFSLFSKNTGFRDHKLEKPAKKHISIFVLSLLFFIFTFVSIQVKQIPNLYAIPSLVLGLLLLLIFGIIRENIFLGKHKFIARILAIERLLFLFFFVFLFSGIIAVITASLSPLYFIYPALLFLTLFFSLGGNVHGLKLKPKRQNGERK